MHTDILAVLGGYIGYTTRNNLALITNVYRMISWIGRKFADESRYFLTINQYTYIEYNKKYQKMYVYNYRYLQHTIQYIRYMTNPNIDVDVRLSYIKRNGRIVYIFSYNFGYKDSYDYFIYPDYRIKVDISDSMNTWELEDEELEGYNDNLAVNRRIYESFAAIYDRLSNYIAYYRNME